ncbi:hypothetical protein PSH87_02615 [Pseudomonas sp. FP453]|uniref:hypothetical protein n=1 Tax=unclassified Pseudomonas TaxID=196821 RepID=UPI0012FC45A5|nr:MULTISPECIES: hypothetical protein [unclassified Pseudomonas]WLH90938.1 hypothetical protein PSH87_02615 [Pseudomonas sp. FP453]
MISPQKAKPPEGGFIRHAVELASPLLRRWINPEKDPDSCQLSLVTERLWTSEIPNSSWHVTVKRPVVMNS